MSDDRNRIERRSMRILEAAGFTCTRLTGADGFRILASNEGGMVLVHVSKARPTDEQLEAMRLFPCPPDCRKLIHIWRRRQRYPDTLCL
jgi:hypothetical protein